MQEHELYMREALIEADRVAAMGEVPVGAVIACEGEIVARAGNLRETQRDPLAHAEVLVIAEAARKLGRWRLSDCSLYVTLEPCSMCAGAIVLARLQSLIFGATDPRTGAAGSVYNIVQDDRLNHSPKVVRGVLAEEASGRMRAFFSQLRHRGGRQER